MGDKLTLILNSLSKIRGYIVKLNYEQRKTSILQNKIEEAKAILSELDTEIVIINQKIKNSEIDDSEIVLIKEVIHNIKKLYTEILDFGKNQDLLLPTVTDNTDPDITDKKRDPKMTSFDLKVAVSLLPVMDDTEPTTNKLIDAIELYDSMLNDEGKTLLIKFVLKTRLSNSAKLRLNISYDSVNDLLSDIKKHLLTKKAYTALQDKLNSARQGNRSIEEFGKELEDLFVNLTISQADGNPDAYNILKPLNEKTAIKRFADGLWNQKLSTIISSRNFLNLKDAIRAAQDEQVTQSNNNSQIMSVFRGRGNFDRNFTRGGLQNQNFARGANQNQNLMRGGNQTQNFRGTLQNRNFTRNTNNFRGTHGMQNNFHNNRTMGNNNNNRYGQQNVRNYRGRWVRRGRGHTRQNVQFAEINNLGQDELNNTENTENHFFRP